ncbi:DJ-1/PfpI family protein [Roseateles amylovorans]|uniref:DJ-1/PfpI family protein n=1 Tax=Roseateles amylovorans TaxID=2978473 RepID=A0ABY6AYD6_9BURK|nr:DJ-1/PfpI family protein [Roseateles amylovorans]UXH77595.1 DJ-1/PfpI family protein [Roseateles amylovorans]
MSTELRTVHLYLFDGFADWEAAFAVAGINNPEFQREPGTWQVRTVAAAGASLVRSMGGLAVLPDQRLSTLFPDDTSMLILPGGPGWDQGEHLEAAGKAKDILDHGGQVAAICGATAGLARLGILDQRRHTSNAASYLNGTGYAGGEHYVDEPVVDESGLITAGGMSALEFAQAIFQRLGVYEDEVLDAWYQVNKTGKSSWYAKMAAAAGGSASGGATRD